MSDQQSPSGQIDLGPWCCYAGENGSPTSECSPENPIHSPTHCGYDNVRRCLVPAPGSGSPAGEQAESSEADQMRAAWAKACASAWAKACASLSPSAPSTPVDESERPNAAEDATWSCKIGPASRGDLPSGSDAPMRAAVEAAFRKLTGHDPEWTFSGWAHDLTEAERAVVEDRLPRPRVIAAEARKQMEQAEGAIGTDLDPEVPERGWEIHEPDDALRIVAAPAPPVSPRCLNCNAPYAACHDEVNDPLSVQPGCCDHCDHSPAPGRRLDVTELPEWAALVDAVNDDGGSVAGYRANVTGRASALTRAVRAAAADREDRADG